MTPAIKPGQVWRCRDGATVTVSEVLAAGEKPVRTYSRYDDHTWYTLEGRARTDGMDSSEDLIELVNDYA